MTLFARKQPREWPDPVAETAARVWLDLRRHSLKSLVVTGCRGGEGATTLAEALARVAQQIDGRRVLLIDANPIAPDLSSRLAPGADCEDPAARITIAPGITLCPGLAAGSVLPPDAELTRFQDQAQKAHDLLIWDSRAISLSLDTRRLIGLVGLVVLVTQSDVTRADHLAAAMNEIAALSARPLAVIRNRAGRTPFSISAVQD